MRIVVNDIAASKTGALAILKDFYNYVKENEFNHHWIFLTGGDYLEAVDDRIEVIVLADVKKSQKNRLKFDLLTGSKYISSLKPDIVLSLQNTLTRGKIYNDGKAVPQILYVHQPLGFQKIKKFSFINPEEREYAVYQYLIGALIDSSVKSANRVIVQTEWMRDAVAKKTKINKEKISKVLPDVSDLSAYVEKGLWQSNQFFFPSGEILYKNHECVIKAAQILNKKGITDFKVYFTLKDLSDVTKRTYEDPYGNICWTGRVSREEVLSKYNQATLIFPSYIETFGVPLAEARQMGTLIVASDTPFCREVLSGYKNVKFFDPFNEEELSDLMEQIIKGNLKPEEVETTNSVAEKKSSYSEIVKIVIDTING